MKPIQSSAGEGEGVEKEKKGKLSSEWGGGKEFNLNIAKM